MMNLDINTKELEKVVALLKQKKFSLESKFDELDHNLKQINGETDVWVGKTQQIMYDKYLKISENFPLEIKELESLILFLEEAIEAYNTDERNRIQFLEDNTSKLDIN